MSDTHVGVNVHVADDAEFTTGEYGGAIGVHIDQEKGHSIDLFFWSPEAMLRMAEELSMSALEWRENSKPRKKATTT